MLRQRRFTSGDVHACVGVSRKVLMDWVRAGIVSQLFHGLGSGKGEERFGKWRLFSILDIWTLAFYKRLRDEGIYIERLRGLKHQAKNNEAFEGKQFSGGSIKPCPRGYIGAPSGCIATCGAVSRTLPSSGKIWRCISSALRISNRTRRICFSPSTSSRSWIP